MRYYFKTLAALLEWIDGTDDLRESDTDCLITIDDADRYYDRINSYDIDFEADFSGWPAEANYVLSVSAE